MTKEEETKKQFIEAITTIAEVYMEMCAVPKPEPPKRARYRNPKTLIFNKYVPCLDVKFEYHNGTTGIGLLMGYTGTATAPYKVMSSGNKPYFSKSISVDKENYTKYCTLCMEAEV